MSKKAKVTAEDGKKEAKSYGLTTRVALARLREDIEKVLREFEGQFTSESCYRKIRIAFVKRYDSPLSCLAVATSLLTTIALLIGEQYTAAFFLAAILSLDLYVVIRESSLRRTEIYRKTRHLLDELKLAEQELSVDWKPENYPHTCCPVSPCVSLQWTYRDGVVVNLPWALLVRGDHIVLRPGFITPEACTEVGGTREFNAHEIYGVAQIADPPVRPVARPPLPDIICSLHTTPYVQNLRIILENFAKRPPTIYNQQRYLLVTKYIQQWGFICALVFTLFAGILHINGVGLTPSHKNDEQHYWKIILIESPVAAVISLLPLIFPIMWISINLWGVARLQCFLKTPQILTGKESEKSFEEDLDTPTFDHANVPMMRSSVFKYWLQLWYGDSELLPRSANVVQVLGSITALCCVDKKGILSWPNPTAEKVFFLHDTDHDYDDRRTNSQSTMTTESDEPVVVVNHNNKDSGVVAEVLDLTHDQHCPFRLEFDDHEWKAHIKSLKPLGLAILLNTCSPLTHAHYAQFCGHVTAVAMLDKDLVPVTNRRCLCELAKLIGFTENATDRFSLEGQLASYRHLQPDVIRRDIRFARQLQMSSKVKVPFPHSLSVVMRENPGGYLSLFTQGTADMLLDCCDDFWDGKDLRPLSPQDRKRALDFYQRSALTAYCTAFAYRPLRHSIHGALSGIQHSGPIAYLELPPESKIRMPHVDKMHCDFDGTGHTKLSHSISTDSLLFSETKDEDINDVDGCFEMQCHQVFIGMVTMQYQAQMDIVQLVERLERACIRFVHFSKENELRSRVFSEKMGLESGWNCHISLLSEPDDKNSTNTGGPFATGGTSPQKQSNAKSGEKIHQSDGANDELNLNHLIPPANLEASKTLSSSAPGAISDADYENTMHKRINNESVSSGSSQQEKDSKAGSQESINSKNAFINTIEKRQINHERRHSQDSALEENCRSISILTESTEQSAPIQFDMSNRAKLPRGIENIRPHLEKVDNVPLQVSLFTDCSAEATRQMLEIMQSYGEIVVCLGSSASNANHEIFLQADCSIAVEPLYPQVCQDIPAYTEVNIYNNKLRIRSKTRKDIEEQQAEDQLLESGLYGTAACNGIDIAKRPMQSLDNTISPIYLSRLLNSLPCSISVCRDDPLSLVAIIELSRRFSLGLWNTVQYWACCAGTISAMNILSACLALPAIVTPLMVLWMMCVPVPLIAIALAHIEVDAKIMNRATGKKQTEYDSRVFGFVVWCYGSKFLAPILITILSYCAFMAHPIEIMDVDEANLHINLYIARTLTFLGILLHFVLISASFVHRDHSIWQKSPLSNHIWVLTCVCLLLAHAIICTIQILLKEDAFKAIRADLWPAIVFLYCGSVISLVVTEFCKWQEIKVNTRYQRRARLDFGTKLGMNSPF